MDAKNLETTKIILAIAFAISVLIGLMYVASWNNYNSLQTSDEQCRVCAQTYNLSCSEDPALKSWYTWTSQIRPTYLNCENDIGIHYCSACYSDTIKMRTLYR